MKNKIRSNEVNVMFGVFQELTDGKSSATVKPGRTASCRRYFSWSLLTDYSFIIFAACNFLSCLSQIVPYIYLPDLGQVHAGLDSRQTAVLILIIGVSNTLIRVVVGFVADLRCVNRLAIFSANLLISGLVSMFVTYYNSFSLLAVYAVICGINVGKCHMHIRTTGDGCCGQNAGPDTLLKDAFCISLK